MIGRRLLRALGASVAAGIAAFGLPVNTQAAPQNIAFVSYHTSETTPDPAAATWFTEAPDAEYTRLLRAAGHNVTRYLTTATPDLARLNTNDLVIISRSVPSGNYQTDPSPALWNSITKPTMILGGYILRAARLGYTYGDAMADVSEAEMRLTINDPAHPIFTGVSVNAEAGNLMVNPYARRITLSAGLQLGISVNTDEPIPGSTILATVGEGTPLGGMVIGEYAAETVMNDLATLNAQGTNSIAAAKRLVFLTGSREAAGVSVQGSGAFDLTVDGARMFLNAVHYMTGQPTTEPPPVISNIRPTSGTTLHLAELGMSFEAGSGTAAGIPVENITLTLNGTNVPTSELTIGGTAQARTVAFSNLVANVEYLGTITVEDAGGRESTASFTFNTLDPEALPASFAFPTSAAVTGSSGVRMRIVQGTIDATMANTEARARAQLAGTLIDPLTAAPYLNEATPSTDNPDGSYNIQNVNLSVEAGLALEKGNFRDPGYPDQPFPGLAHNFNFTADIVAYLELAPGRYYMGVNSDDGFAVYTGPNARDLYATSLGRFEGGRGAADTIFQFRVTEAGLYPFRLIYYQGTGEGSLEWFFMNPLTGEKTLINDSVVASSVKAWREVTGGERPYISAISPAQNAKNVPLSTPIVITIQEPGATITPASVQFTLNGETVSPQVAKNGTTTTITYSQPLPNDQTNAVSLTFTDSVSSQRTVDYSFDTEFIPESSAEGANIVWVSFHEADDIPSAGAAGAFLTNAADIGYTKLLTEAGHTVTRYITTGAPDTAYLQTFDLVIISRSNPSGNFQGAGSTAWHSLTNPTIHLGGYALRANRMGFYTADGIPDTTNSTIFLNVKNPEHPIFAGVDLEASGNMEDPYAFRVVYDDGTTVRTQSGISVNNSPINPGGTVLASVANAGDPAINGAVIAEFPAGTTMSNTALDVNAGHTLIFLTGSREAGISGEAAGMFDLEQAGAKMFLNAVAYMTGISGPAPTDISVAASRNAGGDLVITWPEAGSTGYVLQASDSLSTPNWQAAGGTPTTAGGNVSQTIPTTGTAQFFRLTRP